MKKAKTTNDREQPTPLQKTNATPTQKTVSAEEYDELSEKVNNARTRKPGSQSNSSGRHNNGRGGGK